MVVPPTALDRLRVDLRYRRQEIAIEQKTLGIVRHPLLDSLVAAARCVGLYRPIGGEPDPWPLLASYRGETALPWVSARGMPMIFRSWREREQLAKSSWGGDQPMPEAEVAIPDLIVVPLLGFDGAFNRIGQGGGHYDRYLAAHPSACRIGLAWEGQRVENIEARSWDIPMDAIVTETTFHIKDLTRCQNP